MDEWIANEVGIPWEFECDKPAGRRLLSCSPATEESEFRHEPDVGAPEIETVEREASALDIGRLETKRAVVAEIAAHAQVRGEESHDAAAHIECEVVRRDVRRIRNHDALHRCHVGIQIAKAEGAIRLDDTDRRADERLTENVIDQEIRGASRASEPTT